MSKSLIVSNNLCLSAFLSVKCCESNAGMLPPKLLLHLVISGPQKSSRASLRIWHLSEPSFLHNAYNIGIHLDMFFILKPCSYRCWFPSLCLSYICTKLGWKWKPNQPNLKTRKSLFNVFAGLLLSLCGHASSTTITLPVSLYLECFCFLHWVVRGNTD